MVECLIRDRGAVGSSLIAVTALWSLSKHIYPSIVLIQPRKTRPCLTERLLMGRKESNKQNMAIFHFSRILKYRYVKGSQIKASKIVSHLLNVLRFIRLFKAMIRVLMKSHVSKRV